MVSSNFPKCVVCREETSWGVYVEGGMNQEWWQITRGLWNVEIFSELESEPEKNWFCDYCYKKKKKRLEWENLVMPEQATQDRYAKLNKNQKEQADKIRGEEQFKQFLCECEDRLCNIWSMATPFHWIGWPIFVVVASFGIRWTQKKKKEERKIDNYLDDIKDKFVKWRLNIYLSCAFYIVFFILAKQFIDFFVKPLAGGWVKGNKKKFTIGSMSFILGVITIIDNYITSTLKTPLQRLGVKIENSPIPEKEKSKLLSKTQEANESFKETFKRFGFLAIPGILVSLVGKEVWDGELVSNLSYLVPIIYSTLIILETNKTIRKIERANEEKN